MTPAARGPLLERERELEAIARQIEAARNGDGSLLVVEGPAGIGKTALLGAAAELAREAGMTVLAARGGVLEQQLEYGVARQLVERPVLRAEPERRAQLLAGPAAASMAALGVGELPADPGLGGDPSPQIQHALHWLVANMAKDAPLLIVLDDAHWGDAASLRAGGYLARRLDGLAVAMLVAARDDEPGSQQDLLAELFAAAEPTYLRPAPLAGDGIAAVLRGAFDDRPPPAELVEACGRATGGNPFLLTELAGELVASHADPSETPVEAVDRAGPIAVTAAGGAGDDELTGAEEADSFFGGSGSDTLVPGQGSDLADGQEGDDRLLTRDLVGDLVRGGAGSDSAQTDATTVDAVDGVEALDATQPPAPPAPVASDTAALLPKLGRLAVVAKGGALLVRAPLACPAAEAGGCRTTLTLETARAARLGGVRAVLVLGSKSVRLGPGQSSTATVRLVGGSAGLAKRGALAARVRIASSDAAGNAAVRSLAATLRVPR